MATSDDLAVKSRLLYDGDGTGDDRRLNLLLKQLVKWCSEPSNNSASVEDDVKIHAKLISGIMQAEWTDTKSKLVQDMNAKEARNYGQLFDKIKDKIAQAECVISETKKELEVARRIRRNRMEYDAMAKEIQKHPSRTVTGDRIASIKKELDGLKNEEQLLDDKLEQRKKQFHVLVNSIHCLQELLDKEEEEESGLTDVSRNEEDSLEDMEDADEASLLEETMDIS